MNKKTTLKQFLEKNKINLSNADRSRLGHLLSGKKFEKTIEDGMRVNWYPESYLFEVETQNKIIAFLTRI